MIEFLRCATSIITGVAIYYFIKKTLQGGMII